MPLLSAPSSKVVGQRMDFSDKFRRWCLSVAEFPAGISAAMPDDTLRTIGIVLKNVNPILYRVALPNGKKILAHLSKALTEEKATYEVDQHLILELTPYDFDQARILGLAE